MQDVENRKPRITSDELENAERVGIKEMIGVYQLMIGNSITNTRFMI